LGVSEAHWAEGNLISNHEITTWLQARESILSHYQNPQRKAMLMQELWTMGPGKNETIRSYCDRFCKLMRDCGINDDHDGIVSRFIHSLPVTFQEKIIMVKASNPLYALTTVTAVADLVISLDASLKLVSTVTSSIKPSYNVIVNKPTNGFYCTHHGQNGTHRTAECRVVQSQANAQSIPAPFQPLSRSFPKPVQNQSSFTMSNSTPTTLPTTPIAKPGNLSAKPYTCYVCGKIGHISKECPSRVQPHGSQFGNNKARMAVRHVMVMEEPEEEEEDVNEEEQDTDIQDYQDINDVVNIRKVRISTLPVSDLSRKDNSVLTLDKAEQPIIPAPITLDDHSYIALVDCGASKTLISSAILYDVQAVIIPQAGSIISYDGQQVNRIGITSPITL
jgi:hypothetical protein